MAAWAACALVALVILKPQEFVPALAGLPLVHVAFVLAARRRRRATSFAARSAWRSRRRSRSSWPSSAGPLFVTAVKRPAAARRPGGLPRHRRGHLRRGRDRAARRPAASAPSRSRSSPAPPWSSRWPSSRASGPLVCFLAAPEDWEGRGELALDGRPCETASDCRENAPVPDGNYRCERAGPLSTTTIGGRVRYRGSLADPERAEPRARHGAPLRDGRSSRRARPPRARAGPGSRVAPRPAPAPPRRPPPPPRRRLRPRPPGPRLPRRERRRGRPLPIALGPARLPDGARDPGHPPRRRLRHRRRLHRRPAARCCSGGAAGRRPRSRATSGSRSSARRSS